MCHSGRRGIFSLHTHHSQIQCKQEQHGSSADKHILSMVMVAFDGMRPAKNILMAVGCLTMLGRLVMTQLTAHMTAI